MRAVHALSVSNKSLIFTGYDKNNMKKKSKIKAKQAGKRIDEHTSKEMVPMQLQEPVVPSQLSHRIWDFPSHWMLGGCVDHMLSFLQTHEELAQVRGRISD